MKNHAFTAAFAVLFSLFLFPSAGQAITISPPIADLTANPGDSIVGVVKLFNESDVEKTFYPEALNFGANEDEDGQPQFYPANEDRGGESLASWIAMDTSPITLAPQEHKDIVYTINVPADRAQPGGHYGAIDFATTPPNSGGVGVGGKIASLILVTVSGNVDERGGIAEFGFLDPNVWYNYLPVDFFLRFENMGNTHLRPTGNLFIKDMLGRQVANIKVNDTFRSVLPLSIRRFEFGWRRTDNGSDWSELKKEWKNFAIGKYTATLVLSYGSENRVVTEERVFYVWPWRLMSIVGAGLIVLIALLVLMKRRYDKSVIKRFEKMKKNSN